MNLQPREERIIGQMEFLRTTEGLIYKTQGASLDASSYADGDVIAAGTAVVRGTDGIYTPYTGGAEATTEGAGLTAHDVIVRDGQNPVVGVIAQAHAIEERCTGVDDAFKDATSGRIHFDI